MSRSTSASSTPASVNLMKPETETELAAEYSHSDVASRASSPEPGTHREAPAEEVVETVAASKDVAPSPTPTPPASVRSDDDSAHAHPAVPPPAAPISREDALLDVIRSLQRQLEASDRRHQKEMSNRIRELRRELKPKSTAAPEEKPDTKADRRQKKEAATASASKSEKKAKKQHPEAETEVNPPAATAKRPGRKSTAAGEEPVVEETVGRRGRNRTTRQLTPEAPSRRAASASAKKRDTKAVKTSTEPTHRPSKQAQAPSSASASGDVNPSLMMNTVAVTAAVVETLSKLYKLEAAAPVAQPEAKQKEKAAVSKTKKEKKTKEDKTAAETRTAKKESQAKKQSSERPSSKSQKEAKKPTAKKMKVVVVSEDSEEDDVVYRRARSRSRSRRPSRRSHRSPSVSISSDEEVARALGRQEKRGRHKHAEPAVKVQPVEAKNAAGKKPKRRHVDVTTTTSGSSSSGDDAAYNFHHRSGAKRDGREVVVVGGRDRRFDR